MKVFICTVLCGISCFSLAQTTYYVSNSGSDSNPGTSALPFQTITYAYSLVTAGDTIIAKPGLYTDYTPWAGIQMNKNGTPSAYITLKSQYKWQATLDAGNLANHTEVVTMYGSYNTIEGFEMINGFEGAVYVAGSAKGNRVLNNNIHHNGNIGNISGNTGQFGVLSEEYTSETIYYGNYIHHNGRISINSNLDHGMYLTGDNEIIANNIVSNNCAYGIHIAGYDTVTNMKVYNNVFAWNGRSGGMIWMDMDGIYFRNNIFYKNVELGILCYDAHGTGVVIDNNLWYGNPQGTINMTWNNSNVSYSSAANIIGYDPYFVNDTLDYHVQAGSPALDQGITLAPEVVDDFEGTPRPQGAWYDIGAYEYVTGTTGIVSINKTGIILAPNPATDFVTLSAEIVLNKIDIYNSLGEIILSRYSKNYSERIDISKLPAGIYTVQSGNKFTRLVKE